MTDEQKEIIKTQHDKLISEKGYRVNSWLPWPEDPNIRTIDEIKGRMSVMNAMVNIAFKAPIEIIKNWIDQYSLTGHLSDWEKEILRKGNSDLTDLELGILSWYLESLWALLWVTEMINDLEAERHVGDNLASLVPNLQRGENNDRIEKHSRLRPEVDIYKMLDYYYRLHWYCVDERLHGRQPKLNEGQIYERRRALEWVLDKWSDWDNIEMGT